MKNFSKSNYGSVILSMLLVIIGLSETKANAFASGLCINVYSLRTAGTTDDAYPQNFIPFDLLMPCDNGVPGSIGGTVFLDSNNDVVEDGRERPSTVDARRYEMTLVPTTDARPESKNRKEYR